MLKNITYSRLSVYRQVLEASVGGCLTQQARTTYMFKRKYPVNFVAKGKFPLLTKEHKIYDVIEEENVRTHLDCVLTEDVTGVGLKGQVVQVAKQIFRDDLYPAGRALYPTPENIEDYSVFAQIAEDDPLLTITAKTLLQRLNGFFLHVPMSAENPWVLNKTHIKTAFRVMGIIIEDEFLVLPEEPVTEHKNVVIGIKYGTLEAKVRTYLYPVYKDSQLNTYNIEDVWNNPPVDSDLLNTQQS